MKEYKLISPKFSWRKSREKFEAELNNYAREGWRVVNVYSEANTGAVTAVLERDKNR
ncbi:DUF4177 domain-containing protein [uncultured Tenacibaculum sp.]|uniref:DUF4177 domain-containing protein n=1 Tax=uncultured Tenacibaculum sp. TaxID=174713 RepID=UPI0026071A0A|nr:DUF4177 domain-containing protein [uncultured Tenacibaculum sp.]